MSIYEDLKRRYRETFAYNDLDVYKDIMDGAMTDKKMVEMVKKNAEKAAETLAGMQDADAYFAEADRMLVEYINGELRCPSCGSRIIAENRSGWYCCGSCAHEFGVRDRLMAELERKISDIPDRNVLRHRDICTELNELYAKKNADYGDSYHLTYLEEGMAMARIRLTDKLQRFKKLTRDGGQLVNDESVRDTLIDMANYCIMTAMEMDREREND